MDSNKEDVNEDAFEALFKQLEEDLKADEQLLDDGEDEISEEELAMLERELEEALAEDESISHLLNLTPDDAVEGEEVEEQMEDDVDDEEEEEPITLKGWQLRRLAYALKAGRRKTSVSLVLFIIGSWNHLYIISVQRVRYQFPLQDMD